jgi:hypothetical protein
MRAGGRLLLQDRVAAVRWRGVPSSSAEGNSKVGSKFAQEVTAFLTEEEQK